MANDDRMRKLENNVHLGGVVAELSDYREGNTAQGIPYVSFKGAIQCDPNDPGLTLRFKTFVKSKKVDGSDSKNFTKVKEWYKNALPLTKASWELATKADLRGSISDSVYVNVEGKLVEATEYNVQFFNDFNEYCANIDLEGYVSSITDETKGEDADPTGRQKLRLITRDNFGNTLDIKRIVVPADLVDPLKDNDYETGVTATFFMSVMMHKSAAPVRAGGIGVQRTTDGKAYQEWVLTGASPIIDPDDENALDKKQVKKAMDVRKAHLEEVESAGYLGSKSSKGETTNRGGIGKTKKEEPTETFIDDDDMPF